MKEDPNRVVEEYSQEDVDAVKGPTMIQSMMQGDDDEDGDTSDDDPMVLLKKLEQAGIKTPEAAKFKEHKEAEAKAKGKQSGESQLMD